MLGIDPGPFSLAELWIMSLGRRVALREHAYHIVALMGGNVHIGRFLASGQLSDPRNVVLPDDFAEALAEFRAAKEGNGSTSS